MQANQLDRCKADIRNPVNGNSRLKIVYNKRVLQVMVDPHSTGQFSFCFSVENVNLKPGYYFGLTAATGGLADYHDVYSVTSRDLDATPEQGPNEQPRRRGWFDPYRHTQDETVTPDQKKRMVNDRLYKQQQEQPKQQQQQQQQEPPKQQEDADEHAFFESLREKLKKFGIDDDSLKEQQQQKTETPAPTATTSTPNQQQQQQQQHDDGLGQKTGLLVLEALEEVARTVKASSTKADINNIIDRVNDISNRQANVQTSLTELRDGIKQEVSIMMDNCNTYFFQIANTILHSEKGNQESL